MNDRSPQTASPIPGIRSSKYKKYFTAVTEHHSLIAKYVIPSDRRIKGPIRVGYWVLWGVGLTLFWDGLTWLGDRGFGRFG